MSAMLRVSLLGLSFLFLTGLSYAAGSKKAESNLDNEGFLLHGYDPLSYFDRNPQQGDYAFQTEYEGMNIRFISAENKDKFLQEPERYLPAYGGFCAFGVRMGSKLDIDPDAYEIIDGQLYVLLNRATREIWLEDTLRNLEIANSLWPSIKSIVTDQL